jgi:hypothetical protein
MADVRYPKVKVKLVGQDGNAFVIMGKVTRAMRKAGVPEDQVQAYVDEAKRGNYAHLIGTTMDWVTVS